MPSAADCDADTEDWDEAKQSCVAKPTPTKTGTDMGGRRRRHSRRHRRHGRKTVRAVPKGVHVKAKTLKRLLKSKGLKTTGKKSTLRARARQAHLIRGGSEE